MGGLGSEGRQAVKKKMIQEVARPPGVVEDDAALVQSVYPVSGDG